MQVRRGVQDARAGLPVRDPGKPGGGADGAGVPGTPVQADVPAEQGAHDRCAGPLLPSGRLPPPPAPPGPGLGRPRRPPRPRARRRGRRGVHAPRVGRPRHQHLPYHEDGKCQPSQHGPPKKKMCPSGRNCSMRVLPAFHSLPLYGCAHAWTRGAPTACRSSCPDGGLPPFAFSCPC